MTENRGGLVFWGSGALLAAALVISLFVPQSRPVTEVAPGPADKRPYVMLYGMHSKVTECEYLLARSEGEWIDIWLKHEGLTQEERYDTFYNPAGLPDVDFETCMVVAVFQGRRWNSAGVLAHSIVEEDVVVRLRFNDRSFQTAGPDGGGVKVTPFGIFVIPASKKAVLLEENVQNLKGGPSRWKERHRFDAQR